MNDDSIDSFKRPSLHPEEIFKRYVTARNHTCPEDAVYEICSSDHSITLQDIINALDQGAGMYGIDDEIEVLKDIQIRNSKKSFLESDQTWRESISAEEDFDLVEFPVPDQYKLIAAYKKEGRIGSLEQAVINVCRKCNAKPEDLAKEFEANDLPTLAGAVRYIFSDRRYKYREESEDDENTVSDFKKPDWSLIPNDDFHKIWMGLSLKTQDQVISRAQKKQLSVLDTLIPFLYECGEDLEKLTAAIDAASTNKQHLGFKEAEDDEDELSSFKKPAFEALVDCLPKEIRKQAVHNAVVGNNMDVREYLTSLIHKYDGDFTKIVAEIQQAHSRLNESDEAVSEFPVPKYPSFEDILESYLEFENEAVSQGIKFIQTVEKFKKETGIPTDILLQAIENETQPGTQYEEYDHLLFIADCLRDMLGLPLIHNYEDR